MKRLIILGLFSSAYILALEWVAAHYHLPWGWRALIPAILFGLTGRIILLRKGDEPDRR